MFNLPRIVCTNYPVKVDVEYGITTAKFKIEKNIVACWFLNLYIFLVVMIANNYFFIYFLDKDNLKTTPMRVSKYHVNGRYFATIQYSKNYHIKTQNFS